MVGQSEFEISYLPEKPLGLWAGFFMASFILHVLVIAIIVFFPSSTEVTAVTPPVPKSIKIDLVSFDPELPSLPSNSVAVKKKEKQNVVKIKKKGKIRKRAKRKTVKKSKPIEKIKKSLKARTFHPEKIIRQAVSKIEKKVEADRPEAISERINEIKKDFSNTRSDIKAPGKRIAAINPGNLNAEDLSRLQVYQAVVADIMRRNWVFSDELAGGDISGLESRVVIKILPDGTITDVWFDKRSGNAYLDETAERTVKKSNPLPPLPAGIPYYHLVLGFTPSGIKR